MSARIKQAMRFCTRHRGQSPIACLLEPCTIRARLCAQQTLYLTVTREAGHRRRMSCMRLFLHNCLSIRRLHTSAPHTVTALSAPQAPRECSAHRSRTTTSTSKGWTPDHCATKKKQLHWRMCEPSNTPTKLHESQIGSGNQQRKKQGENSACTAPQNFRRSRGKKENNPAAPPQHRQKDVFGLRTKHALQNECETTQ